MILSLLTDTCDIYSQPDQVNTVELELFSPRVIQVNYDFECTPLFRAIQRKDWEKAAEIATEYPEQVRTWVLRYHDSSDGQRILRWRMLPIHALFLFSGTHGLAVLFLFIYPDSVSLTDDQDMMPLHLACRNGALFETFEELLTAYPQALHHKDYKGRTPLDLVMISSHRQKEELVSLFVAFGGVSSSLNGQIVPHDKRNQASFSPVSKTKGNIGNVKLLRDGRDIQHDEHRHSKDSTPKIITIDKSKNFVQSNTMDADCLNSKQSSNGSTTIVEKSQINEVETECNGKIHGQSHALHEKTLTTKPASTARTVTMDPVATTHFFSDSLKKAPKSPRVLKIASEKRKSSIKVQIIESKQQPNQQQALQFSTNDLDHSVHLSPSCKKNEEEPDGQQSVNLSNESSHRDSTSTPVSNALAETSSSNALLKTSLLCPDVSKGAISPESQTPKLKEVATVLSVSRNFLDKMKPCLQTVSENTKSEAKMLIQTMREQRMQLFGKSCSDKNDHKILEIIDSAEPKLKGPYGQNASLVGASFSKASNETQNDATLAVTNNTSKDSLVHEAEISCDKPEVSTNEQTGQMLSEVKENNNICEINELQAPITISASGNSCVVLNDKYIKEDSSTLPNFRDKADLGNGVQQSVEANEDETLAGAIYTTLTTVDFLIAPFNHERQGIDSGSPTANAEHMIDITELKGENKVQLSFTSGERHIPVDSNGPLEAHTPFQPQERVVPFLSIDILDSCTQVNNISSPAFAHEMISDQNENMKTSDLEEVTFLKETSSLGIHRVGGKNHDSIGVEGIGCLSQDEHNDEGKGETEGSKFSAAPTHLSDNEVISSHICTDKMSEGAAAAEGITRFGSDEVELNSESQVDEMTLHVAAADSDQMEVVSEVAIKLEGSSAYNEKVQSNAVGGEVCNGTDNYLDSFVGHTQIEVSCSVDCGQDVEDATELYMLSPLISLDQEARFMDDLHRACHEPEPVQSDESSGTVDSDVVSNDSPKAHLPDVTQQQNDGNIINEPERSTQTDVSRNVEEKNSVKEHHTDTCIAKTESLCDDFSYECERNSVKIIEQTAGDINKPHESGPKILNSSLPFLGEVELNREPLAKVIGFDEEDVHFIDLSLNVIDLVDDTVPGTMCLSALKFLEEKKRKMSLKITSDFKDHVLAKNKRNSDAINKAEESAAEKKNNIPSYVRLHYDAMKLVLKSERRDDDVSSTSNIRSQEEKEVSYANAGENREGQLTAINDAVVSKSSATKVQSNDTIPTYIRMRNPKSTNYFSHTSNFSANINVLSPRNEISLPSKNYKVEKNVDVKERAKEQTKDNVISSSSSTIVKKYQWQSKLEAHSTTASNAQLVSPNKGGCNKHQFSPGKSFISEQKHLDNCNEKVKRPSMRLRSSWISPSS